MRYIRTDKKLINVIQYLQNSSEKPTATNPAPVTLNEKPSDMTSMIPTNNISNSFKYY